MSELTVSKWGNSLGVRLPSFVVHSMGLSNGDKVSVSQSGNAITLTKVEKSDARRIIEEFYGCPYDEAVQKAAEEPHETELDWGSDVGAEVVE